MSHPRLRLKTHPDGRILISVPIDPDQIPPVMRGLIPDNRMWMLLSPRRGQSVRFAHFAEYNDPEFIERAVADPPAISQLPPSVAVFEDGPGRPVLAVAPWAPWPSTWSWVVEQLGEGLVYCTWTHVGDGHYRVESVLPLDQIRDEIKARYGEASPGIRALIRDTIRNGGEPTDWLDS